ncbi:MAG: hypothetical protein DHS20C18_08200 [Saprospiraceae bacterium]|nr:MAG: hypothetical protein DHS20C18_08200 [Saprospiraceae bacterium]
MNSDYRREAERKVKEKIKFHNHLRSFIVVNTLMLGLTLFQGQGFSWIPIIFFWGIGLFSHYMKVYGLGSSGYLSKQWEENMIEKEMRKMKPEEDDFLDLDKIKEKKPLYDERDLV